MEASHLPPPESTATGTNLLPRLRSAKQPEDVSAVGFAASRKPQSKEDVVQPWERALHHDKAHRWSPQKPGAPPTSQSPDPSPGSPDTSFSCQIRPSFLPCLSAFTRCHLFLHAVLSTCAECLLGAKRSSRCLGDRSHKTGKNLYLLELLFYWSERDRQ